MKVERRAPGPASENLQWRKPRDVWRGGASDAMGISTLAICCRGTLNACLGSDRGGDEPGRLIATGRTGVAERRSNDTTAIKDLRVPATKADTSRRGTLARKGE
jgi:hypothetical protein